MQKESRFTRNILSNSGYFLILDYCTLKGSPVFDDVINIVEETLTLACSSRGVPRIPYFGLAIINAQFEIIWKLSRLKGQYSKLTKCLDTLKKISLTTKLNEEEFLDYLHMGLKQILSLLDDSDFSTSFNALNDYKMTLNIVLLTRRESIPIKFYLKSLMEQLDMQKVHRLEIVELNDTMYYNSITDGLIHLIQIHPTSDTLEKFFKNWLVDLSFDREDLIIKIAQHELKCDLKEILFDTGLIPFGNVFHINKEITNSTISHLPDPVMPVYCLEVIERISSSGMSECSVFSYPLHITPTRASKYDAENLRSNSEKFDALCKTVYDSDEYLIARLKSDDSPTSYFVLMPGDGTFLIKSLACRELMVSFMKSNLLVDNELDYEVRLEMNNAVFELPLRDEYDSRLFRSNICASLKRQLQTIQPKMRRDSSTEAEVGPSNFKRKSSLQGLNTSENIKKKVNNQKLLRHLASIK